MVKSPLIRKIFAAVFMLLLVSYFQNCGDVGVLSAPPVASCENENCEQGSPSPNPNPNPNPAPDPGTSPAPAPANQYKVLVARESNSCVLHTDSSIKCWGDNVYGQLAAPKNNPAFSSTPLTVKGSDGLPLKDVVYVGTSDHHSCALMKDTTVLCWGSNSAGQLGNGPATADSSVPVNVKEITGENLKDVIQLSVGDNHTCVAMKDLTAKCWGNNNFGELGNGQSGSGNGLILRNPVTVLNVTGVRQVLSAFSASCAVINDGSLKCWGQNWGNLGNNAGGESSTAVNMQGLSNVIQVSGAANYNLCALSSATATVSGTVTEATVFNNVSDGKIQCWGSNNFGQMGNGSTAQYEFNPVTVTGITNAIQISSGGNRNCALLTTGDVKCWGGGYNGMLGDGTSNDSKTPIIATLFGKVVQVVAGFNHTCVVYADNTIKCVGYNYAGQLGDGSAAAQSVTPVLVKD